jgi:hypothetical protein
MVPKVSVGGREVAGGCGGWQRSAVSSSAEDLAPSTGREPGSPARALSANSLRSQRPTASGGDILETLAIAVRKQDLPEVEQWDPELVEPNHNSRDQACVSGS